MGGSILSTTILLLPLKQNIFFVSIYLATASREDGAQALKLQFEYTNPLSWVSSLLTCAGKKSLEDERGPISHQLAQDELCVASGVLLFIWFFPLTIFPH